LADLSFDNAPFRHLIVSTKVPPDSPNTITNSIGMKFVPIPAGEFLMGSPEDCPFAEPVEECQHRVRITKPFLLGMHQVTQ
jgi:formylglycine-generating enzyme required for sulfatase activity